MSAVTDEAIKMIENLPEDATLDKIIYELHFKSEVDSGLKELDEGEGITHDEIVKKWKNG